MMMMKKIMMISMIFQGWLSFDSALPVSLMMDKDNDKDNDDTDDDVDDYLGLVVLALVQLGIILSLSNLVSRSILYDFITNGNFFVENIFLPTFSTKLLN